jgi:hypothetical protein
MKIHHLYLVILIGISTVLMSHNPMDRPDTLDGTWVRKVDNLRIRIQKENASIIEEGNLKFACDVSAHLIYKDIRKDKDNHWTCNFLVVTMGSCKTNYEAGEMFIDKEGDLVVICPGFLSKVYTKVKPRYDS